MPVGSLGQRDPPGVGTGNPLQYSCLENSMDSRVCPLGPWGLKELDTTEPYSHTHFDF